MTQPTPADELRAAAQTLRTLPGPASSPTADWLDSWTGIDIDETAATPEDLRHALAVARAINGSAR